MVLIWVLKSSILNLPQKNRVLGPKHDKNTIVVHNSIIVRLLPTKWWVRQNPAPPKAVVAAFLAVFLTSINVDRK